MRLKTQLRTSDEPVHIFVSYAHEDERHRVAIEKHLGVLSRTGAVRVWQDRCIAPGVDWEAELNRGLEAADVILLLISPDFVASDYCWDREMTRALERHSLGEATVVPIHVRKVAAFEAAPFGALQMLPRDGRAISDHTPHARGYERVASELVPVLAEGFALSPPALRVAWVVTLEGDVAAFSETERRRLERDLRRAGGSHAVTIVGVVSGSVRVDVQGSDVAFGRMRDAFERGELRELGGLPVVQIDNVDSPDLGATLRVEARPSVGAPKVEGHGEIVEASPGHRPPLLRVLKFPLDAPQELSFEYDPGDGDPTAAEAEDLDARLGRYFMTAVVVRGEDLRVNLSPYDENCGLPEPLKRTELGRDLLAQDLELKRLAASLMHPHSSLGRRFWERVLDASPDGERLSSIFRVWVTPGKAGITEATVEKEGRATLESHEPDVLCDLEYDEARGAVSVVSAPSVADEACLGAFRELILPEIRRDVLSGRRFGLLRQMHSAVTLAAWYRRKLGPRLAGFMDSNRTAELGLDRVEPDEQVREEYLRLFEEGLWRANLPRYDADGGMIHRTELVAGGIHVDPVTSGSNDSDSTEVANVD